MDWNAVSAISGVFAATFVALSVVYLALQVKAGTRATRSQTYYLATAALADMAALIASDERLARIVRIGWNAPDELNEDEFTQYSYLMTSFLRRYENVFFQHGSGLVDEDFWRGHRENLLWAYRRPGMQRVWMDRRHSFSISFQEFLGRSNEIALETPDSRRL
jgi:hypothetical protein